VGTSITNEYNASIYIQPGSILTVVNLAAKTGNLSEFNKGTYISGMKVFNHLPQYIKALTNDQKYFKFTLTFKHRASSI